MTFQRAKALLMREFDAVVEDTTPVTPERWSLPVTRACAVAAAACVDCGKPLNKRRLRCGLELCLPCAVNFGREQNGLPRLELTASGAPRAKSRNRRSAQ